MKVRILRFLAVLGVAGCAPSFSNVEEARQYLLQSPDGALAQEAFCIVAAAGETGTLPDFSNTNVSAPKIENCTPDGRVKPSARRGLDSAYEAY